MSAEHRDDADLLTLVARYAPSRASLTTWTQEREDGVLDAIARNSWWDEVGDIGGPARRTRARRAAVWAPALAAACVLALVAGLAYAFGTGGSTPSGGSGDDPTLAAHPWHARAIRALGSTGTTVGHGSHLYVLEVGTPRPTLLEIDPGSGAVQSRATVGRTGSLVDPVWAGGRVWVASQVSSTRVRLSGFTPDLSDAVHRTITLPLVRDNVTFDLTAPVDGSDLYFSTGRDVLVLSARTGRTAERIATSADQLSVSPDGSTLYVVNAHHTEVTSIDTATRHVTGRRPVAGSRSRGGYGTLNQLAATDNGYLVAAVVDSRPGRLSHFFYPSRLPGRVRIDAIGTASAVTSPTHAHGGVAWGSGGTRLSCVDPGTGRVLARSASFDGHVSILLTDLNGHLYGTYDRSRSDAHSVSALVELTPPKACGLS